jgi:uncharacterized protein (TIGR03032 family)
MNAARERTRLRARHDAAWRDPAQVVSQWSEAGAVDPKLLRATVRGRFWETLAATRATLLVTREYEHFVLALRAGRGGPRTSWLGLPHPSGVAVDATRGVVHVAATRNPNQVYDLTPTPAGVLLPRRTRFLPGALYLHDLALIGGVLHANAVGQNAVVRLDADGTWTRVWWPRCIETTRGPDFARNYLQLNSIAAGPDLAGSFFSASGAVRARRRPGDPDFPVDRRGVVFAGATREVVARGLTRPHSARFHDGRLWLDDSGYGEVGVIERGGFTTVAWLPGWTRGLAFHGDVAFVGTSRVLPRFRQYAPGLDLARSICGVHAVDVRHGRVLGSITWEAGNQIFAVECVPQTLATALPFTTVGRRPAPRELALFSTLETRASGGAHA